jgi:xanthine dehydrogenase accessory factor
VEGDARGNVNGTLLDLAAELRRQQRPFVIATVVWSRSPSSGDQGGSAIIEPDGTMHGWIGGACAAPSVLREARRVLDEGEPQLMYLGPAEELDGHHRPGVVTVPIACSSEGALEVFMEPIVPAPHVVIVGGTPGVARLADLLAVMGWSATVVDDPADVANAGIEPGAAVIVASQGNYDESALEAALATPASFIGLVASRKRAETVLGYLHDRGVSTEDLARIESPAGFDLGSIAHDEIPVAVLARLVQLRAAGRLRAAVSGPVAATAIDPVCGMTVEVATARFTVDHGGQTFYFCAPGCAAAFEREPAAFLA